MIEAFLDISFSSSLTVKETTVHAFIGKQVEGTGYPKINATACV